ncbi:helix-turn-helix domain-containing protein [Comamonas sp. w2-DMI]|uniref:helix-turn-helix domain-containing protein n=1 Tax=Comamonas sp. w2-DMI TaxID=3126391 RepID=UPI0032E3E666
MSQQVLEPASVAEAEMAATATSCLIAALDHSRAETVKLKLDFDDGKGECPELLLPPKALRFFASVLRQMAKREPMLLVPQKLELTTQEAAAFLNVSRPFVIKEIEQGRLKCRMVNRHRRIEFEELVKYQTESQARSEQALSNIAKLTKDIGQEL